MAYREWWSKYYRPDGSVVYVKEPERMPRINDELLDAVFYLYPTLEAAQAGEASGGTGFFASVPCQADSGQQFIYAVTNKHIINDGYCVLRVNQKGGALEYIETNQLDWKSAEHDDISIYYLGLFNDYRDRAVSTDIFLTKPILVEHNIGPGDDVFMIGRFINREGQQRNSPSVRFGNISILHGEPVRHRLGHDQETISVEMRSIGGYSGSPVFVYLVPFSYRGRGPNDSISPRTAYWFLGVDYGHVEHQTPVRTRVGESHEEGLYVLSNSAMSGVVPAWNLTELLNISRFALKREEIEQGILTARLNRRAVEVLDDADTVKEIKPGQSAPASSASKNRRKVSRRRPLSS